MNQLFETPLLELKEYKEVLQGIKKQLGPLQLTGCMDSQKVHMMSQVAKEFPYRLIVTYSEMRCKEIFDDYKLFHQDVWIYPAKDFIFYSADIKGNALVQQRLKVLYEMIKNKKGTIITTIDGLMNPLMDISWLEAHMLEVKN